MGIRSFFLINFTVSKRCLICLILGFLCINAAYANCGGILQPKGTVDYQAINCRKHSASLADFGGKGDGNSSNTAVFKAAIANLSKVAPDGGAQLVVPPGKWLTGSFSLISHFTLYLHKDAVLLASQEESEYPLIEPLPSYGRGRDAAGKRFQSLIFGTNLTDVVVTGGNGTIDGQGATWWRKFKSKELNNTRPYLIEILYSNQVQISDLTLLNSPSWHVHPTYCRDVIIERLTILAPVDSPNTDGINPDSCINTRIRDSYVVSGDDCIAVKSGWDQYGIKFGMPTQHLSIRQFTCISPDSAVIALGSEMSGGIQDVRAEEIYAINSESGVRIKTSPGRGAYVKDIFVRNVKMNTMKYAFWMTGSYGSHPDEGYDPKAIPVINNINYMDMTGKNVTIAGNLAGIEGHPFTGICISNVHIKMAKKKKSSFLAEKSKKLPWNCTHISGMASGVIPKSCGLLEDAKIKCSFPADKLEIDNVELKKCSVSV